MHVLCKMVRDIAKFAVVVVAMSDALGSLVRAYAVLFTTSFDELRDGDSPQAAAIRSRVKSLLYSKDFPTCIGAWLSPLLSRPLLMCRALIDSRLRVGVCAPNRSFFSNSGKHPSWGRVKGGQYLAVFQVFSSSCKIAPGKHRG